MDGPSSMSPDIPAEEYLYSGHSACAGCGAAQVLRLALKGLGERTMLVIVASCTTPISGVFPFSAFRLPLMHMAFAAGGAAGSGVRAALDAKGIKDIIYRGFVVNISYPHVCNKRFYIFRFNFLMFHINPIFLFKSLSFVLPLH